MSNDRVFVKKDIKTGKETKIRERPMEEMEREYREKERAEKLQRKEGARRFKQEERQQKLKQLQVERQKLLSEHKQRLEMERTKAEIKRLKREKSISRRLAKGVGQLKQERRELKGMFKSKPTKKVTYKPRKKPSKARMVSDKKKYVIIDGVAYPIGKPKVTKRKKVTKPKKKTIKKKSKKMTDKDFWEM